MPSSKASRVLVLDETYRPVMVITWTKAFVLMSSDAEKQGRPVRGADGLPLKKAIAVASYDEKIRSASTEFDAPAVIVLTTTVKYRKQKRKFSRRGIYARDRYTCQYCVRAFSSNELTLDHVIPQSRGGRTSWDNIVAACLKCNQRKADKTPAEAGMEILNWPAHPSYATFAQCHDLTHIPEEWVPFIPDVAHNLT